ncbi:hypothetical protein Bca4012_088793 [Brassica carinata]
MGKKTNHTVPLRGLKVTPFLLWTLQLRLSLCTYIINQSGFTVNRRKIITIVAGEMNIPVTLTSVTVHSIAVSDTRHVFRETRRC